MVTHPVVCDGKIVDHGNSRGDHPGDVADFALGGHGPIADIGAAIALGLVAEAVKLAGDGVEFGMTGVRNSH